MKPKYKNKKFKSKKAFDTWLDKTTKYVIDIEDKGQDFLTWWIDERGEVLHSDVQAWLWNGKIVDVKKLLKTKVIQIGKDTLNYKAKKVTKK